MIRFIHCIKSRPEISLEKFREFWHGAAFNQLLSEMSVQAGTRRISKNLTLNVDANSRLQEDRGAEDAYDAILEIWFDSATTLLPITEKSEVKQLFNQLEKLQQPIIDFHSSKRFFTEWNES
ncbi:MAG: EthD domain-containing protein [Candidatus Thiodiazotropha sp. (ex Monitilora ramsayi)]|nr:EthD domain-containing protein [Candidatus Thiodiazotropha sp. (ex Monitilora ramsayi)]